MKGILFVYLCIHAFCGAYIVHQLKYQQVITHIIFVLPSIIFYAASCYKNPGFAYLQNFELQESCQSAFQSHQQIPSSIKIQSKMLIRYCKECKHNKLVRMKHCHDCQKCVATFDHHCVWIDNCVGQKNRHFFYLCILTNLVCITNAFRMLVIQMWNQGSKETYQISFLSFLGILIGALVALFAMHSYMMIANLTTWQLISWQKMTYFDGHPWKTGSPFSAGIIKNIKFYWCLPFSLGYKIWIPNRPNKMMCQQ